MSMVSIASGDALAQKRASNAESVTPSLRSFQSDAELDSYLRRIASLALDAQAREDSGWGALCGSKFNLTRRSMSTAQSLPSANVVVRVSVRDTAGKSVSNAMLDIDGSGVQSTTHENGEGILVIPADKLPKSRRVSLTARGMSYKFRRGQFRAYPGDTIDIELSLCDFHMVLQQAVITTGGSTGARADFGPVEQQGVDDGDDVRVFGRFLLILRRGRLYSFDLGSDRGHKRAPRLVGFMNLYGATEFRPYYTLMLRGNQIVAIGYHNSERELGIQLFRIADDGVVGRTASYQFRVDCMYVRCAAHLAGDKLVLFSTSPFNARSTDPLSPLPAMRRMIPDSVPEDFHSLVTPQRIFRFPEDSLIGSAPFMNTFTTCDVKPSSLSCRARVIIGPRDDDNYVSPTAGYVWTHEGDHADVLRPNEGSVTLFRIPLSSDAPQAIRLTGGPFDQLSLSEDDRGSLRLFASGDSYYGPRSQPAGAAREVAALFTIQTTDFGDGTRDAAAAAHRTLPLDEGEHVRSQFVGTWLYYSVGGGYFRYASPTTTLFAVRTDSGIPRRMDLPYYIERIAPLASDAMVVGTAAADTLHFLRIDPSSTSPLSGRVALANPSNPESENFEFSYRMPGFRQGLLAIPGSGYGRSDSTHWVIGSTSVVFVRATPRGMFRLGSLSMTRGIPESDSLEVQSGWFDDWFGNSRGIFVGQRIFALIGYELIEARIVDGRIVERQRINFMPGVDQRGWH
jgi:hypothetical protein